MFVCTALSRVGSRVDVWAACMGLVLCLGVFMQMLGVPASLWDVVESFDIDYLSFLEDFAIHTNHPLIEQRQFMLAHGDGTSLLQSLLHDRSLFRPPTIPLISPV